MSGSRWIVACIFLLLFGMLAWHYPTVDAATAHLAATACDSCHLSVKTLVPAQAGKLISSQEILCGKCHANAVRLSHPSGLTPKSIPPAEYPLDWKGDLTCSTCHQPHGSGPGLLRGTRRGRQHCMACHESSFFIGMKDQGASMEQSGHLSAGIELRNIDLDVFSLQCLQCHETRADPGGLRVDRRGIMRHAGGSANHPIGRSYEKAARFGGYRPAAMLSKKIILPDGKVSCVSCHLGYSKDHGRQVIAKGLCQECHDL